MYVSVVWVSPGTSPSPCPSDVDFRNHKERTSGLMVSGAGSMEPLEEGAVPETAPTQETVCDGAVASSSLKELESKQPGLECALFPSCFPLHVHCSQCW